MGDTRVSEVIRGRPDAYYSTHANTAYMYPRRRGCRDWHALTTGPSHWSPEGVLKRRSLSEIRALLPLTGIYVQIGLLPREGIPSVHPSEGTLCSAYTVGSGFNRISNSSILYKERQCTLVSYEKLIWYLKPLKESHNGHMKQRAPHNCHEYPTSKSRAPMSHIPSAPYLFS